MSLISCLTVSCLLYHVVSCLMSHISCLNLIRVSQVSHLASLFSCLTSPVSLLLSPVSCLTSPASGLTSPFSHLLPPVSCFTSPVSLPSSVGSIPEEEKIPSKSPDTAILKQCCGSASIIMRSRITVPTFVYMDPDPGSRFRGAKNNYFLNCTGTGTVSIFLKIYHYCCVID